MLTLLVGLTASWAVDIIDDTDRISAEVCVEYERPLRDDAQMPERGRGFLVPESWARARAALGRGRAPTGEYPAGDFAQWLYQPDAPPTDDAPLALTVEAAPHPIHSDRLLVRVALRAPDPTLDEREPVHLVALVNVAHSMRSVPTRTYPLLQDVLPTQGEADFFFPKVDRLGLARTALHELVGELPRGSVVALAAFDSGAHIALEPTPVRERERVDQAIDALQPGFEGSDRGLDLVVGLVERMRSFCGDTRVIVFSDGRTGLGGDPDQALDVVAEQASHGVTVSTVAAATGLRRVPQLEQLAWVGYGQHHYADTLSDALAAFRRELAEPGWIARDVRVGIRFDPEAVAEVRSFGGSSEDWTFEGLPRGTHRTELYEVVLADGADTDALVEAVWEAGSPVPAEWTRTGAVSVGRREVPASFQAAPKGVRMAWIASAFADNLAGRPAPELPALIELALKARREGVREDVELIALMDRAARLAPAL